MSGVLVVLSGGQDSTTCLYWAKREFAGVPVEALSFDYGQRHRIELESAREIAALAGVPHTILPINTFAALGGSALTDENVAARSNIDPRTHLPNTFVPGRNLILLTFAAAFAYQRGLTDLVTGVAQTDYSGYPDCRSETVALLQEAIQKGMECEIRIHTPLMFLSKRQTVELAREVGALQALALSHTCYNGKRPPCGTCPACVIRAKGFAEAGIPDPLVERFAGAPA